MTGTQRPGTAGSSFLPGAAIGFILLLLAACGGASNEDPTAPTPQQVDAKEALRNAVSEVLQLESAAFTLEHVKGSTTLLPGLQMSKAFGTVDIPDRFSLTVEAELAIPHSFVRISVVTIEDQAYMTDIISGRWRQVGPEILPFNFSNLSSTLAQIIEAVDNPVFVRTERLLGHDTHRIRGRIRSQDLSGLVPGAVAGFDVELDLWLEQARSLLRRILLTGMVIRTDDPETVRMLTLDDINTPVEISAPE